MSASDKKKIRKVQAAEFLTERQRAEQAEAKKLRIYTITFVAAMLLIVVVALGVLGVRAVNNSGVIQKNTLAATVGDNEINSVELNYYYNDAVNEYYNEMYNQFGESTATYLQMMGLDVKKPLDKQIQDTETGKTWAEYFIEQAINTAKVDYAMAALADADKDFKLDEDELHSIEHLEENLNLYATLSGMSNANQYLRAVYGYGSDVESYQAYNLRSAKATAYIAQHREGLTYDDPAIRKHEDGKYDNYTSFTYDYSYMSYTEFRTGGTKDEKGNTTYSEADDQAAREAMKTAAEEMATATSLEELKKKAEAIKLSGTSKVVVNEKKNHLYTNINTVLAKWLADSARKDGDIAAIPNESTTKNEDGTETTVINGYYVALYHSKNENKYLMSNVRHLLVEFECAQEGDHDHEEFTDEEKAKAKTKAEGYLKTWNEGKKTEESFIELVKKHSDDSSAEDGGLFEKIHNDSNYVPSFRDWATDSARKPGDCEIIESEYGYHVMYFVGNDEMNYRDYMISEELRKEDHETWYNGIIDDIKTSIGDTSKMRLDVVLG